MKLGPFGSQEAKAGRTARPQGSNLRVGKDGFDITFRRGAASYTIRGYHLFALKKVQKEFNIPTLFTRKFKGIPFSILYDFEEDRLYMVTIGVRREVVESIFEGIEGLEFENLTECLDEEMDPKTMWRYSAFPLPEEVFDYVETAPARSLSIQSRMYYDPESLADVYRAMRSNKTKLLVSFMPASEAELEKERVFYEKELGGEGRGGLKRSEKQVSFWVLLSNAVGSQFTSKPVRDLSRGAIYEKTFEEPPRETDPRREHIARTIVSMCNNAKLTNDAIFRVAFFGYGENSDLLEMHFRSKFPCLKEPVSPSEELTYGIPQMGGDVMSGLFASNFIYFPKRYGIEEEKSLKGVMG